MRIIKTYRADFFGNAQRKQAEKKLFKDGFKVIEEREIQKRAYSGCAILFLFVIFFPLAILALVKIKYIKVTYEDVPGPPSPSNESRESRQKEQG